MLTELRRKSSESTTGTRQTKEEDSSSGAWNFVCKAVKNFDEPTVLTGLGFDYVTGGCLVFSPSEQLYCGCEDDGGDCCDYGYVYECGWDVAVYHDVV